MNWMGILNFYLMLGVPATVNLFFLADEISWKLGEGHVADGED